MIQYTLKCDQGHSFDSWFGSSDAFDTLKKAGQLSCAMCGSTKVDRAIMAPRVTTSRKAAKAPAAPETNAPEAASTEPDMKEMFDKVKKHVEANSDYVGENFASEARAMYLGDAPERSIYGEAKADDAKALIEDGVPVMPLPFTPTRKTN